MAGTPRIEPQPMYTHRLRDEGSASPSPVATRGHKTAAERVKSPLTLDVRPSQRSTIITGTVWYWGELRAVS